MHRKAPLALLFAAARVATALLALPATAAAADKTKWLCKPGLKNNPCVSDLTATILHTDATTTTAQRKNAKKPGVDCFYLSPPVNDQKAINADRKIAPEIRAIADYQAARFSQV